VKSGSPPPSPAISANTTVGLRKGGVQNRMKRVIITVTILSLVLVASSALPAAFATASKPFNGSISGSGIATSQNSNHITATGHLTGLGKTTLVGTTRVTGLSGCGGFVGTEQDTLTAANGDQISITGNGVSCPSFDQNVFQDTVSFTITGGTGRFAEASGSGTIQTTLVITSPTTSTFSATITGTISY